MRSSLAVRSAWWLAGLTVALWMTAGGTAGASTVAAAVPAQPARLLARRQFLRQPQLLRQPQFLRQSRASSGGSWTVYHGDPAGLGAAASSGTVDTASPAWTSPALDGELYGEPLVSAGRVFVATENDTVYALSARTGAVVWSRHLATPVPAASLPCGDITPTVGITGTPVIDPRGARSSWWPTSRRTAQPAHVLAGLSTATGRVRMTQDVDPPGADTAALLQRTGLTLAGGRVVFGFGGNDGDCAAYRGRVVAVPETGGAPAMFTVDSEPGQSQGAVWMGGAAPAVDSHGNVWVSAGNGSVYNACPRLRRQRLGARTVPLMRLQQYFAPSDLAVEQLPRPGHVHRARAASRRPGAADRQVPDRLPAERRAPGRHRRPAGQPRPGLRGTSTAAAVTGVWRRVPAAPSTCPASAGSSPVRAAASPPGCACCGLPGSAAARRSWPVAWSGRSARPATLSGIDPATGQVRQQASIGAPANHFPTPSVGDGLLLAPSADRVVAFRATGGSGSHPATPASAARPGPRQRPAPGGTQAGSVAPQAGLSGGAIAGIVAGGLVVLTGIGWLVWRRAQDRP